MGKLELRNVDVSTITEFCERHLINVDWTYSVCPITLNRRMFIECHSPSDHEFLKSHFTFQVARQEVLEDL